LVAAAGDNFERHSGQRTVLHRASLATVEALLAPHGFVRIHRSRLVARRAVARVRATDIILHDGVSLTIGARYRAQLQASIDSKSRPFVPKRWHLSGERSDRSASQRTREDEDDTRDSDRTDGNGAADAGGGRQTGNSDRRPDPEGDHAA
jgi:hypothetical protein